MKTSEYLAKYDRIFIDHTAFKSPHFNALFDVLLSTPISEYGGENHVIVTQDTIKKLERSGSKHIDSLSALQKANIGYYRSFPVSDYEVIFERFTTKYSLLLITQDQSLAHAVLQYTYPVNHKQIGVVSLGKNGELWPYIVSDADDFDDADAPTQTANPFSRKYLDHPEPFKGIDAIDVPLKHSIPIENATVHTPNNGSFKLLKRLARGGEGVIFETNKKAIVAKIYNEKALTKLKEDKLKLLISKPLNTKRIAYPIDIVLNSKNQFVGYIMYKAKGSEIRSYCSGKSSANTHKNWTRLDAVTLCISVLETIKAYHSHNLLIGDINEGNFMVNRPDEITLVDVDSAQVEKYPCPVGRPEFTPPELLGNVSYKEFFRTFNNEYYSIAVLLFRIITVGLRHTAKVYKKGQSSPSIVEKIQNKVFAFHMDDVKTATEQNSRNAKIWSHLPSYIKQAFVDAFSQHGKNTKQDNRLNLDDWLMLFESYKEHLENGELVKKDDEANTFYFFSAAISYKLVELDPIMTKDFTIDVLTIKESIPLLEDKIKQTSSHAFPAKDVLNKLEKKGIYKSKTLKIQIIKNIGVLKQLSCQFYR